MGATRPLAPTRSTRLLPGAVQRPHSDNLMTMTDVTATDAARHFADLLDAIEHRGERFTIVRRGRAVAHLEPVSRGRGADVKAVLRRHRRDAKWGAEVSSLREILDVDKRR